MTLNYSNARNPVARRLRSLVADRPACPVRIGWQCLATTLLCSTETKSLGGLNEYGIAAYKTVDNFAQREVEWILSIGGIDVKNGVALGTDFTLAQLREQFDAVFLGIGLGSVNELGVT